MDAKALYRRCESGLAQLDIELSPDQISRLIDFIILLEKWNRLYNLTSIRRVEEMIDRHILDSLVVLPWLTSRSILDVGSGAGLPGIPLAIAVTERRFTLLECQHKKTRFIRQAVIELKLDNVEVVTDRSETYRPPERFPLVLSRAVGPVERIVAQTKHLMTPGGRWLLYKGADPWDELQVLSDHFAAEVVPVRVPGITTARYIVEVSRIRNGSGAEA